jgi:hypothetical protein
MMTARSSAPLSERSPSPASLWRDDTTDLRLGTDGHAHDAVSAPDESTAAAWAGCDVIHALLSTCPAHIRLAQLHWRLAPVLVEVTRQASEPLRALRGKVFSLVLLSGLRARVREVAVLNSAALPPAGGDERGLLQFLCARIERLTPAACADEKSETVEALEVRCERSAIRPADVRWSRFFLSRGARRRHLVACGRCSALPLTRATPWPVRALRRPPFAAKPPHRRDCSGRVRPPAISRVRRAAEGGAAVSTNTQQHAHIHG